MANPEHLNLLRMGRAAVSEWRQKNSGIGLELSRADLREFDLREFDLVFATLTRADLRNADLTKTNLKRSNLEDADLSGSKSDGKVYLIEANCRRTKFNSAILPQANFEKADLTDASLDNAVLHHASLNQATLSNASLKGTDLNRATFLGVKFESAHLLGCRFRQAHLEMANFVSANIAGADFFEASLSGGDWTGVRGANRAVNLEAVATPSGPNYFEHCERAWQERYCDWEWLRTFGRMPLFGLSYSVLILIPVYIYVIAWYNHQVERLREWQGPVAEQIGRYLHDLPLPGLSLLLLVSTILLAVASTIYTIACPSRVKEFTRDVWCDQLGRSLFHYWPVAWKRRRLRLLCGACYLLGGVGAVVVLTVKIWNAGAYILRHTSL